MKVPWWSFLDKTSNTSRGGGEDIRHLTVVAWHDPLESCELTSHLNDKSLEKAKQWWMRSSHRLSYTLRIKKPCHELLTMGDLTLWRSTCYSRAVVQREAAAHPSLPSSVLWWLNTGAQNQSTRFFQALQPPPYHHHHRPRARVKLIFWFLTVRFPPFLCAPIGNR